MIEFQNVSKLYGDKAALSNLNLQIENGEIMGLIGHNGAGKSTTIKSLVSIISPSSGRILVDGLDLSENRLAIKRKIGYVADSPDLFLRLTANEFWELIASSYDLSSSDLEASLDRLLKVFDFAENRYQVIETLSHGMRQKVLSSGHSCLILIFGSWTNPWLVWIPRLPLIWSKWWRNMHKKVRQSCFQPMSSR